MSWFPVTFTTCSREWEQEGTAKTPNSAHCPGEEGSGTSPGHTMLSHLAMDRKCHHSQHVCAHVHQASPPLGTVPFTSL